MTGELLPLWLDDDCDRGYASDGASRYGFYVRDRQFEPWTEQDRHVELAAWAWRVATGPVMAPVYVRCHPRVLEHIIHRAEWDGSLVAPIDLAAPRPQQLVNLRGPGNGSWRDWPSQYSFTGEHYTYRDPYGGQLTRSGYLLASVPLRFTLPPADLPQPPADRQPDVALCKQSVAVLAGELNRIVGPAPVAIEGDC